MSQVIVLHWDKQSLRAVVAGRRVAYMEVDAVIDIPIEETDDAKTIGHHLKTALIPHRPSRARIVLAISRGLLQWKHLNLPPCPAEELPDLVYMQAGFDTTRTGEAIGFDFLPLSGNENTPHQIIAISLQADQLNLLQDICEAADLSIKRYIPLLLGWPAVAKRATRGDDQPIAIFVAPFAKEASIWATHEGRLVLLRQLHFPSADNLPELGTIVSAELRRTFHALTQQYPGEGGAAAWIVGKKPNDVSQLAKMLNEQLDLEVQPMDFAADSALLSAKVSTESATSDILPLAGIALNEAAGNAPLVDLLHPRQRPAPRAGKRTYALAAAALVALLAYGGSRGYAELNAPIKKADVARAQIALLTASEEKLKADELFAEAIQTWQDSSVNVLGQLQELSKKIRPSTLDAEQFDVEQDVVLKKLEIGGKRLDMEAALRTYPALAGLEARLRDGTGRVKRATAEENESPPDYLWLIRASVDFNPEAEVDLEEKPKS